MLYSKNDPKDSKILLGKRTKSESYLDLVGAELGVKKFEDWYQITNSAFGQYGHSLLNYFNYSLQKALCTSYT